MSDSFIFHLHRAYDAHGELKMIIAVMWELFWRAILLLWLLYAVDYALDGKLDLPYKSIEWEELRIAKWLQQLITWLSHVTHHKPKGGEKMQKKKMSEKEVFRAWVASLPVSPQAQKSIEKIYLEKEEK